MSFMFFSDKELIDKFPNSSSLESSSLFNDIKDSVWFNDLIRRYDDLDNQEKILLLRSIHGLIEKYGESLNNNERSALWHHQLRILTEQTAKSKSNSLKRLNNAKSENKKNRTHKLLYLINPYTIFSLIVVIIALLVF